MKAAALILAAALLLLLPFPAPARAESFVVLPDGVLDKQLSDEELAELLYALSREGEDAGDFIVLPDDFVEPAAGLDGTFSLLLIGVDTDAQGVTGRSDTMVLAVVNIREKTIHLISFLRDLYVKIPGRGNNRLNAAYVYGGPELLVKTLSQTFGVQADAYFAVDFGLMATLVDAVGGVEVLVTPEELSPLNGILEYFNYQRGVPQAEGRLMESGYVRLTGLQAMSYARIRKLDSDFGRAYRQQAVLKAIVEQLGTLEPLTALALVTRFAGQARTDVTLTDALALVREALPLTGYTLIAISVPVEGGSRNMMKNGSYYLLPNLKKNTAAIRDFLGLAWE